MLSKKQSLYIKTFAILMIVFHHISLWTDMLNTGGGILKIWVHAMSHFFWLFQDMVLPPLGEMIVT